MAETVVPPISNVRVGVAAIVRHGERMLLGKRIGSHGEGTWQFPGGHLEHGEAVIDCARREVREETGLELKNSRHVATTNDVFVEEGKHYVTLFVRADVDVPEGEEPGAELVEPHRCEKWEWRTGDELRAMREAGERLFLPMANLLKQTERIEDL